MDILNADGTVKTFIDSTGTSINLEYRYLEYNSDGYVVAIYVDVPASVQSDHKIAISDNRSFEVGNEFDNYIIIQEVDSANNLTSSAMIKQPQSVKYLTTQLTVANETIKELQSQNAQMILSLVTGGLM